MIKIGDKVIAIGSEYHRNEIGVAVGVFKDRLVKLLWEDGTKKTYINKYIQKIKETKSK